jgi:hypothetical protein
LNSTTALTGDEPKESIKFDQDKSLINFYNPKNIKDRDEIFVILQGVNTSEFANKKAIIDPLINNGYPLILIGNGILPTNLLNIQHELVALDTDSFKKINVIILTHGYDSKKHFKKYQNEIKSHHRIEMNHLFTEKTRDLFIILKEKFPDKAISIVQYSCYGGLAIDDAEIFGDNPNFDMVTFSPAELPTACADAKNVRFSEDANRLKEEIINFPYSFLQMYLKSMYAMDNYPIIYKGKRPHDVKSILTSIDNHERLKEYLEEKNIPLLMNNEGRVKLDDYKSKPYKDNHHILIKKEISNMVVNLDEPLHEEEEEYSNRYYECLENTYQNKDFCSKVHGEPRFGLLQYALFEFYFKDLVC